MLCTEIDFDIQNNLCTLFSQCSAKIRASDKDLTVTIEKFTNNFSISQ